MSYDHMKYVGRRVQVYLEGGWSSQGVLEVFTTEEELVINSPTGLISIPAGKVCAIQLSLEQPAVYQEQIFQQDPATSSPTPTQSAIVHDYPHGYDNGVRNPPGVVPVSSGKSRRETPLMEKLRAASEGKDSGSDNHYGSIIPNDMLMDDEPDEQDLSITFSPISPGNGIQREIDDVPTLSERD